MAPDGRASSTIRRQLGCLGPTGERRPGGEVRRGPNQRHRLKEVHVQPGPPATSEAVRAAKARARVNLVPGQAAAVSSPGDLVKQPYRRYLQPGT